jgi:hypothetical protein
VVVGGGFAFSISTDPDAFMLVELRDQAWFFGFARSNVLPIRASVEEREVWAVDNVQGD